MRALVSGGAGFIGSHLVDALLAAGHEVVVLDDFSSGRPENVARHVADPRFRLVRGDVRDGGLLRDALRGCDVAFHLAAVVGVRHYVEDPLRVMSVGADGTAAILAAAWEAGARVVFASTSEVYGRNPEQPLVEGAARLLGDTSVDRWCYATAKALGEHLCFGYRRRGLPVVVLRYFNAYGPRAKESAYGGVVPRFIRQALAGGPITVFGDGLQTRSFTYVEDTVRGTLAAALEERAAGEVFNIGHPEETPIARLAERVRDLTGSPARIARLSYESFYGESYEEVRRRVPSVEKAGRVLGFTPRVALDEGLALTIDWCRNRDTGDGGRRNLGEREGGRRDHDPFEPAQ